MRRRVPVAVTLAVVGSMAVAACEDGADESGSAVTVRDSAGVRIVENGAVDTDEVAWTLSPEPVYRVGWEAGGPLFENLTGGALLSGGRAVVTDYDAAKVTVLAADGSVERGFGRRGEGPGEFGSLMGVEHVGGDTLLIEDRSRQRIWVYHGGEPVRDIPTRGSPFFHLASLAGLGSGGEILYTPSGYPLRFEREWQQGALLRLDPAGPAFDTVALFDFVKRFDVDSGEGSPPFRPFGAYTVTGGRFAVGRGDRSEVRWIDAKGSVVQIARWSHPPAEVTNEILDVYEAYRRETSDDPDSEDFARRTAFIRDEAPDVLPHFGRMVGDAEGNVWVGEYDPGRRYPSRYFVIASDGRWVGAVEVPERFEFLDIGSDRVLAIERDPFDVEAVAMYRLRKPGG